MGWGKRIGSLLTAMALTGMVAACGQVDSPQSTLSATTAQTNSSTDSVGPTLTEDQLKLFNETMDQWQRKNDGTLVESMGPTLLEGSTMNVSSKGYHAGDAYEIGVWCMGHGSVKAKWILGDTLSYTTEVQCSPQIGAEDSIFTGDDAKESTMTHTAQDDTMAQVAYRIIKVEDYKSQSDS